MKSRLKVIALKRVATLNNYQFKTVVKDGVTYEYDELKEGADIWFVDADGVVSVPPNGVYTIEDKAVTVADGIMTAIEVSANEETVEETKEEVVSEVADRLAALEEAVLELVEMKEEFKKMKEKLCVAKTEPEPKFKSQLSKFGL